MLRISEKISVLIHGDAKAELTGCTGVTGISTLMKVFFIAVETGVSSFSTCTCDVIISF